MQAAAEALRACWECREVDDLGSFEKLALDSFAAVLDVKSAVGDDDDGNGEGGAEADLPVQAQFSEVMVSAIAVPNLLCRIALWFWFGGNRGGWGWVSSLDSLKLTMILEHHIPP